MSTAAPTPAEMGKTALLVRMNELQSENYSLRSRLQSTVEELRIAQRAAQKKVNTSPAAPAVSQRAASLEVVSCTIDKEVQTTTAGSPGGTSDQQYIQKITKLQQELQIRSDKIAALESGTARTAASANGAAINVYALEGELAQVQAHNVALEAALRRSQAVEALDAGSSDVLRELRAELAHVLEQRSILQAKADALGRENHQQRIALGLERQSHGTAGPSPAIVPAGGGALVVVAGEDSAQCELSQAKTLFRLYGKQWSTEELERLLHQDESLEVDKRLHGQQEHSNAPLLHIEQTLAANQQLRDELSSVKDDLMLSHQKIEELSVTVQLHAKYQDLHVSKSAEIAASESAQQAASEIAFLCDTLAAMKSETEYLNRKLSGVIGERDTALAAFEELRLRSDQLLHGCEEIASNTQQEAQVTIQAAQIQLRSRERELSLLRGELLVLSRQLDEQRQLKASLESELVECRTKLMSVKDTCSAVRTEAKQAKMDKQAALLQLSAVQKQLISAQEKSRQLEGQLATAHRVNVVESSRQRRGGSARASSPSGGDVSGTPSEADGVAADASPGKQRVSSGKRAVTPNGKGRSGVAGLSSGDSDELKQCFLSLQALVPEALTARDVTNALRTSFEKTSEHRGLLEAELRKKASALAKAKKNELELQEKIEGLQKKVAHLNVLERKLEGKDKLIDKTKREMQAIKDEDTKVQRKNKDDLIRIAADKTSLEHELALVRRELDEGKEVMLQLLRESID
jgi:hypothetical protein